jgi:hypothetical protein
MLVLAVATAGADGAVNDASAASPVPVVQAGVATEATLLTLAQLLTALRATDTPFTNGDPGVLILAKRRDADTTTVSADGDYTTLNMDEAGRLKVAAQPGLAPLVTGNITANAQTVFANISRQSNVTLHMVAASLVGEDKVWRNMLPSMGGEDFSFMLQAKPGAYIRIGQGLPHGPGPHPLHNSRYDFNDEILPLGAALHASLVEQALPLLNT